MKEVEWTHNEGSTYYRVTAKIISGQENMVTAMIQVKGKAESEFLPIELGSHVIRLLNLFTISQKQEEATGCSCLDGPECEGCEG